MTFHLHTIETAPLKSKEAMRKIQEEKGFVPNIVGILAGAPPVLEAFVDLGKLMQKTSFSPEEKQIVYLAVSQKNGSTYCMAAHSTEAADDGLSHEMLSRLRAEEPLKDEKLEALRQYALAVMKNRGRPDDETIDNFLAAGYKPAQALEIVLAIAYKTLTNYANRLAHPPIDKEFSLQDAGGSGREIPEARV